MSEVILPTPNTELKRSPRLGCFDRATIYQILDEAFICHDGFVIDEQPFVIPTAYGRCGDNLLIHGSAVVLARSVFDHSMNYRSVVILGRASLVGEHEKLAALRALTEHIIPQRWAEARPSDQKELKATTVLALSLQEASAKIRSDDPIDDEEDYALDVWAGVIPFAFSSGEAIPDGRLREGISVPQSVATYKYG